MIISAVEEIYGNLNDGLINRRTNVCLLLHVFEDMTEMDMN
jgi:hypothetical protein